MSWLSELGKHWVGKLHKTEETHIEEPELPSFEISPEAKKALTDAFGEMPRAEVTPVIDSVTGERHDEVTFITDEGKEVNPFTMEPLTAPSKEDEVEAKNFHADCTKMWIVEEGCIVKYRYNSTYTVVFEVGLVDDHRDYCHPVNGSVVLAHELLKDSDDKTRGLRLTPELLRHFRIHGALCSRCRVIVTAKGERVYDTDVYKEMLDNYEKVGV